MMDAKIREAHPARANCLPGGMTGDTNFRAIGDAHEQVAATATRLGQTFAGEADNFATSNAAWNGHAEHCAGDAGNHFNSTPGGAVTFNFQIAAEVGAACFETEMRQRLNPKLHEAARERPNARQSEARAGCGVGRDDEFVLLRAIRVGGVGDADGARGAAQEIFKPQIYILRNIALEFSGAPGGGEFFSGSEFAVVGGAMLRVA